MSSHFQWSEVTTMKCCQGKSHLIHLGKVWSLPLCLPNTNTHMGASSCPVDRGSHR